MACITVTFIHPDILDVSQYAVRRTCAGAVLLHGSLHPLTPCPCQPAGCQLSQELEHMKKELERVKGELGMWGWLLWGWNRSCATALRVLRARCSGLMHTALPPSPSR